MGRETFAWLDRLKVKQRMSAGGLKQHARPSSRESDGGSLYRMLKRGDLGKVFVSLLEPTIPGCYKGLLPVKRSRIDEARG